MQVGAFLVNSLDRALGLDDLADRALAACRQQTYKKCQPKTLVNLPRLHSGACCTLLKHSAKSCKMPQLHDLTLNIEWPVIPVLARMEQRGMGLT